MNTLLVCLIILSVANYALLLYLVKKKPAFKKSLHPPSEELVDFLGDLKRHGYGVVRIDPENLMYRSPRATK